MDALHPSVTPVMTDRVRRGCPCEPGPPAGAPAARNDGAVGSAHWYGPRTFLAESRLFHSTQTIKLDSYRPSQPVVDLAATPENSLEVHVRSLSVRRRKHLALFFSGVALSVCADMTRFTVPYDEVAGCVN